VDAMMTARHLREDAALTADPASPMWADATAVVADRDPLGAIVAGHRTEIRARWTDRFLFFLFTCPYETLYLKQEPSTDQETNLLWNWDVAEVFIGADFERIRRYKEFQVSPQGEWVDLDINRETPGEEIGWRWQSGMSVEARVDRARKIWYGAMKIPFASIDVRPAATGQEFRLNLFRLQGPPPDRKYIAWQPTGALNYHIPEKFGRLRLDDATG